MASVTLRNIKKSYGNVQVIHGVNLDIDDGSFVVLLGPSGCGKSTLLRSIAGLEAITSGDINIGDRRVNDVHPKDRDIAMVFQNYALYAHMTVKDNMSFSMVLAKKPQSEIDEKTAWAAKILNLEPYLARYPRELSGGQRQRVAMGRAIVRNPSVFLFDEPLSNLDAKLRVQMRTEIKDLHERLKTTTVYVTHDQIEAMTMADKIVLLQAGRIEQVGTPLELYDHPKNMFVAGFIGSPAINFLPARSHKTDAAKLIVAGGEIDLPEGYRGTNLGEITVGIRPEHLRVSTTGIPASVSVIEPTGAESHIVFDTAEGKVTVVLSGRTDLRRGMQVHLNCLPESVHLFDRLSTNSIAPGGNHA
jgi:multiple sugar transport system ATP-binding protein